MPKTTRKLPLLIIGAGDQARDVLDILAAPGMPWKVVGLVDVNVKPEVHGTLVDGVPVLGDLSCLPRVQGLGCERFLVAVGDNQKRRELFARVAGEGFTAVSVIHPSAQVSPRATLGEGVTIHARAFVGPGARIDKGVILNVGAAVAHDCRIGEFAHVAPLAALCGHVLVGELTLIGVGASVRPQIRIGRRVVVGAGAAVVEDVEDDLTVVGVPAKKLQRH